MRSFSGRVAVHRLIRSGSLLALATMMAAACTTSRDEPSRAAPRTQPPTVRTTGAVPSACTPGSGIIATVAGSWPYEGADDQLDWRSSGDGGPATKAQLNLPADVEVDAAGNVYILEHAAHPGEAGLLPGRVRMVDTMGLITTVVGPPAGHSDNDAGKATEVDLRAPLGITLDAEGNLYVGGGNGNPAPDFGVGNSMVVKVDRSGQVTTVAGTGEPGFSGDGGPATKAQLNVVGGLAFDRAGSLYIADMFNNRIRKVDPSGVITTVAGTGKAGFSGDGGPAVEAQFNGPGGIAVDTAGNVYIAEAGSHRIRRIDPAGIIETVAGGGKKGVVGEGGPATEAGLLWPADVWVDAEGNLYIADSGSARVRKVDPAGVITTVAGIGVKSFSGDGGPAIEAALNQPLGVTLGTDGALYIAEFESALVRRVCL